MSDTRQNEDATQRDVTDLSRYATENSLLPMAATEGLTHIVRYANPAFCRLSGRERGELFGRAFAEVMPTGGLDEGVSLLDHVYRTGKSEATLDQKHPAEDGKPVYWSYAAWALLDKERHPAGVMLQITDTTEAALTRQSYEQINEEIREINQELLIGRIREQELLQARQMEGIGKLAGGIAHHFNNLLTAMLGFTELAQNRLLPDDEIQHYLHNIKQAAERAATLTNQLLAFARKQMVRPNVLDLNALIRDIEEMLRHLVGEHIELAFYPKSNVDPVTMDPGLFGQVLINLVANARDAMPHGGRLTIETANVTLDDDYVREHREVTPGAYVLLTVSDMGTGMSKEVQAHLFEPFFTTKEVGKGAGMGLAACYGIVKQSGGHIQVDSALGRGTVFKIYLPRVENAIVPRRPRQNAALPQGTESVVLAEDDSVVREIAAKMLRQQGYTVIEASGGNEALSLIQQYSGEIDLIVTDVLMPQMGGKELTNRLRATRPRMKTLFISGYSDDATVQQRLLDPAEAFLQKPFTMSALAHKVRETLDADVSQTP